MLLNASELLLTVVIYGLIGLVVLMLLIVVFAVIQVIKDKFKE